MAVRCVGLYGSSCFHGSTLLSTCVPRCRIASAFFGLIDTFGSGMLMKLAKDRSTWKNLRKHQGAVDLRISELFVAIFSKVDEFLETAEIMVSGHL